MINNAPKTIGELIDSKTYDPAYLNFPIYLEVEGEDGDNMGVSWLSVFIDALENYREKVTNMREGNDKKYALITIDEMMQEIQQVVIYRLSETATLLHTVKYNLV